MLLFQIFNYRFQELVKGISSFKENLKLEFFAIQPRYNVNKMAWKNSF